MHDNYKIARNILLIRNGLTYCSRFHFETDITSTIWIELSLNSRNKILVMGGYSRMEIAQNY